MIQKKFFEKIAHIYLLEFVIIGLQPFMFWLYDIFPIYDNWVYNVFGNTSDIWLDILKNLTVCISVIGLINLLMVFVSPNKEFKKGVFLALITTYLVFKNCLVLESFVLTLDTLCLDIVIIVDNIISIVLLRLYWHIFNRYSYFKEKEEVSIYFFEFCIIFLQLIIFFVYPILSRMIGFKTGIWVSLLHMFLFSIVMFGVTNIVMSYISPNNDFKKGSFISLMILYLLFNNLPFLYMSKYLDNLPYLLSFNLINGICIWRYLVNANKYKSIPTSTLEPPSEV